MNKFLEMMEISFRRDPSNFRPRINKHDSQKDQEQKKAGNFFLMDEEKLTKEEEQEEQDASKAGKSSAKDKGDKGGKGGAAKGGKKGKKDADN